MEKGREDEARKALVQIRKIHNVDNEINSIRKAIADHKQMEAEGKWFLSTVRRPFIRTRDISPIYRESTPH